MHVNYLTQAKEARLIDDNGMEKMVPLNQVNVDDILLIKPVKRYLSMVKLLRVKLLLMNQC